MGGNVANGSPIGDSRAGADGARRRRSCCAAATRVRRMPLRRLLRRLHEEPARAGRVRAGDARCRCRRSAPACAPTRSSKRFDCDISARVRRLRDRARRRACVARRPPRLRRHGGDRRSAPPQAEAALRRPALDRGHACDAAKLALAQRLHAADRHARERRLPAAGGAEPAAPLLARNAHRRRRSADATSVWSVMPHAALEPCRSLNGRTPRSQPVQRRGLRRLPDQHAARIDARPRPGIRRRRVGISRPHESAQLHVAGEAPYIDDMPELAGTLHARARPVAGRARPPHRRRPRRASARCRAWSRCSPPPTFPGRTTAARSSTTTRSSPTATSATSASRCSR